MMYVVQLICVASVLAAGSVESYAKLICPNNQVACADNSACISLTSVCNYNKDCTDSSDETNFKLCKGLLSHKQNCQSNQIRCQNNRYNSRYGSYSYLNNQCMDLIDACLLGAKCLTSVDILICDEIKDNQLKSTSVGKAKSEFGELVQFLANSLNETLQGNDTTCPPFYKPFNDVCLSVFTPVQISWAEAKIFCESILGTLAVLDESHEFIEVLTFLKNNNITSKFWLGGWYQKTKDTTSGKWLWVDGQRVKMGAPYWSITLTDPSRSSSNTCSASNKQLSPKEEGDGRCLAILDDNFYFFSDEACTDKYSPICVAEQL